jgi:hypothetical protein
VRQADARLLPGEAGVGGAEEVEELEQEPSCRMCEAKAAKPDFSTLQIATTVLASLKLETEQRIGQSQERQRLGQLEKVKLELRVAELEAERVEGMGEFTGWARSPDGRDHQHAARDRQRGAGAHAGGEGIALGRGMLRS